MTEITGKLELIRKIMSANKISGLRLRSVDWFAWATGGGSSVVILTAEIGIAEVFITENKSYVLTDKIESARLAAEELTSHYEVVAFDWFDKIGRNAFVSELIGAGRLASDRPVGHEVELPLALQSAKLLLVAAEVERYRQLGLEAAQAMTETLLAATPSWTEYDLAATGAANLWKRGIHPTLTLVGGEERLPIYRHATASAKKLGSQAMLVFCARKHGLYANLTRFVYFKKPTPEQARAHEVVAAVEATALKATTREFDLSGVYRKICAAYESAGFPDQHLMHHQGGPTGYLSREAVAGPETPQPVLNYSAFAWNPSVPGAKIEDTFFMDGDLLENLTFDPEWPHHEVEERLRPGLLLRT